MSGTAAARNGGTARSSSSKHGAHVRCLLPNCAPASSFALAVARTLTALALHRLPATHPHELTAKPDMAAGGSSTIRSLARPFTHAVARPRSRTVSAICEPLAGRCWWPSAQATHAKSVVTESRSLLAPAKLKRGHDVILSSAGALKA